VDMAPPNHDAPILLHIPVNDLVAALSRLRIYSTR
jgi:hypothetical protein